MQINDRYVGPDVRPYIIAEAADAHMGNMEYAKALVRMAANCHADAIKFQHHLPDEEMLPDRGKMADNLPSEGLYAWLKKHALTLDQHKELRDYCDMVGITYLCTPFSWKAAQEINPLVPAFKIGSGEAQDFPTLSRIAGLGKPMIVSTGMCDNTEVVELFQFLTDKRVEFALMHCVSEYPPCREDLNIGWVKGCDRFSFPFGYSSHWPGIEDAIAAMALGACIIEKHVTLTKHLDGPDASVSIDEQSMHRLVQSSYIFPSCMRMEKRVHQREYAVRKWAYRSLVIVSDVAAGQVITADDIWSKRPGTGIPAKRMQEFIGKKALCDIPANTMLREDMCA